MQRIIENSHVLVTGGAGFIGSNLIDDLLKQNNEVICLDNYFAGKKENLEAALSNPKFTLIEGDIRDLPVCRKACDGMDYVLHQAAVGSVPRSIEDPILSTDVNIMGFLNMLVAARDAKVKRFVYAASSSTYGDSTTLPKVEDEIGIPLSPYAITKYVNELYANNFSAIYGLKTVGLRYFNVFGRRQDPFGAYAAVIPNFVIKLMKHEAPVINGDGSFSRDFAYIDNVIQANQLAALADIPSEINPVFNIAGGERTDLNMLFSILRENLSRFDPKIGEFDAVHGPTREGDIPHSLADISKARKFLGYDPQFSFREGLHTATEWYYRNL